MYRLLIHAQGALSHVYMKGSTDNCIPVYDRLEKSYENINCGSTLSAKIVAILTITNRIEHQFTLRVKEREMFATFRSECAANFTILGSVLTVSE